MGTFHHFELARELEHRNHLDVVYTSFPWVRVKREGVAHRHVETFPYIHTPQMVLAPYYKSQRIDDRIDVLNCLTFDRWVEYKTRRRPAPDAFIAISGSVYTAALRLQERGSAFICDRGSTHKVYQERILNEEYIRWGLRPRVFDPRIRDREVLSYEAADAITVPSHAAARSFIEQGVPASKIHVIPYGVRLQRFTRVAHPPTDSFEVLFVGSVGLRKGIPYLLQAFRALQHPRKRLTIIGALNLDLGDLLATLPTDDVRFLGTVHQDRISEYMSRSHVMVLPSIEEGLALVQGQAMACGCPILATPATGAEDIFTDGVEGFIVPTCQVAPLTERMQQLADDPQLQAAMGEAALAQVTRLGGWRHYGDLWEDLLKSLAPDAYNVPPQLAGATR